MSSEGKVLRWLLYETYEETAIRRNASPRFAHPAAEASVAGLLQHQQNQFWPVGLQNGMVQSILLIELY